ncbi:MAG: hypothetical protein ACFFDT_00645 [Candidatus Hodarchaeota archaeon]
MVATDLQIMLQALFTITAFTILIKENPLSRIGEHIVIGGTAAHVFVTGVYKFIGKIDTYTSEWYLYFPIIAIGVLLYTIVSKEYRWYSRYPTAIMLGIGTGLTVRTIPRAQIVDQIALTLTPFTGDLLVDFSSIIILIGVIAGMFYFLFDVRITDNIYGRNLIKLGAVFVGTAWGVGWASNILGRGSVLLDRIVFILYEWLQLG